MASRFAEVPKGVPLELFALNKAYIDDTSEKKVNLGIGAYRDDEGDPWVLPVVRKTEQVMANDETQNHEYLPVLGNEVFSAAATKLLLGEESTSISEGKAIGIQTISGTGALRVGAEFLNKQLHYTVCYISNPTWENHPMIFKDSGFTEIKEYRYWDAEKMGLNFECLIEDLTEAPENSVIILHACGHNPTGSDPTQEQWSQLAELIKEKNMFPFFDIAYQGFASGDVEKDAWAVRHFAEQGLEFMCAQSFSKNFGLYNERPGNLTIVVTDPEVIRNIKSQLTLIVRGMYSNPPNHGVRIVTCVLTDPELLQEWKECVSTMSSRVQEMRIGLKERLVALETPGTWDHITTQIGMFSFTGLTAAQTDSLVNDYHIYMTHNGRMNMCGLTSGNLDYVAQSINNVLLGKLTCQCKKTKGAVAEGEPAAEPAGEPAAEPEAEPEAPPEAEPEEPPAE